MNTERLSLRYITTDDAEFLYGLMNTHKWHLYIGDRGINSIEDAYKYIEQRMDVNLSKKGFINHVMIEKNTGKCIGTCSLHDRDGVEGIDIGYALLPEYEGKGYASEGAKSMVSLAFEKHGQHKVSAITTDQNSGSFQLLEKIGFTHKGYITLPNSTEKLKLYILEKKSWVSIHVKDKSKAPLHN